MQVPQINNTAVIDVDGMRWSHALSGGTPGYRHAAQWLNRGQFEVTVLSTATTVIFYSPTARTIAVGT